MNYLIINEFLINKMLSGIPTSYVSNGVIFHIHEFMNIGLFYIIMNGNDLDVLSNPELVTVKYSSNDSMMDIINRVVNNSLVEKYKARDCISTIIIDKFTNHPFKEITNSSGIYFHHNDIPLIFLSNKNNRDGAITSVDCFFVMEQSTKFLKVPDILNEEPKYNYYFVNYIVVILSFMVLANLIINILS